MKKLNNNEIKEKLIKYLQKKDMNFSISEYGNLKWIYEKHNSKFTVKLFIYEKDENKFIITYDSSLYIKNISKKKTTVSNDFCNRVYKFLSSIKNEMDESAEKLKKNIDNKNRYCLELERHFKKIYKFVSIYVEDYNDTVDINISARVDTDDSYRITYFNNKYYLKSLTKRNLNRILN